MRHVRAWTRIAAILVLTGVLYLYWSFGRLFTIRSSRRQIAWRNRIVRLWARLVHRIIGLRVHRTGSPPEAPFCLVSNHLSYVDIILMMAFAEGVMIAKADIRDWPLIGWLAPRIGTIFLDRESIRDVVRVGELLESTLDRKDGIVFFPEGTSTRGLDVGPFRAALLDYAARVSYPVHYATIGYVTRPEDPPASEIVCWWGDMTFADHLYNLLTIPRFDTHIHFEADPIVNTDRKELAAQLREAVRSHFTPVRQFSDLEPISVNRPL